MKKLGSYIAIYLAGFSTMAIIALKWFNGDDYSLDIKKIKNKRSSGDQSVPIHIEVPEKRKRRTKAERKQDRLDKRLNKT